MKIKVTVNGQAYIREVAEHRTLLRFLREDLGLIGAKEGCGMGECGACTVFLNGRAVNSCMVLAVEADGATVDTVEGENAAASAGTAGSASAAGSASRGPGLSELQAAFERNHAVQCGFCTPGMVMSVKELLRENPKPSAAEVAEAIEGNFCRCTGYTQIVEAVLDLTGQTEGKGGLEHVR